MRHEVRAKWPTLSRVGIIRDQSWLHDLCYSDLFDPDMNFPEREYEYPEMELTPRDQFIVKFCEFVETLKSAFTPQSVILELITFELRPEQSERFAAELWWCRGGLHREAAMKDLIWRNIETRISTMMKAWWKQNLPADLEDQVFEHIPSTAERFGGPQGRHMPLVLNPRASHERDFFGMEAPLVMEESVRKRCSAATHQLIARLQIERLARTTDVVGLTTSPELEVASEIFLATRASHELSKFMGQRLLSGLAGDECYGDVSNLRAALTQQMIRRKMGAILFHRLIPGLTPEQWLDIHVYYFGCSL